MALNRSSFIKTICIDFDGVIHSYKSGWEGPEVVSDDPVPGALDWLAAMIQDPDYKPVIYSARSKLSGGIEAMRKWFDKHGFLYTSQLEFPTQKPGAWLTIDDRCICFRGTFPSKMEMNMFKPWNR
jgi:hypothetical protein